MEQIIFEHSEAKNFLLIFNCDLVFILFAQSLYFLETIVYENFPEKRININGETEGYVFRERVNGYCLSLYRNGVKDGPVKCYDNGILRKEENWSNGVEIGPRIYYTKEGKILNKDTLNGYFVSFYPNGEKEIESTSEGNKSIIKDYYENGALRYLTHYTDNKFDGLTIRYYPNGNKDFEANYKNGELDGLMIEYYENGVVQKESNYRDDKLNGLRSWYHPNGKIQYLENYVDDVLDGITIIYDLNGQSLYETVFDKGIRIS